MRVGGSSELYRDCDSDKQAVLVTLTHLRNAVDMVGRRRGLVVASSFVFSLVTLLLLMVAADINLQYNTLDGGRKLRNEGGVAFSSYYPHGTVSEHDSAAKHLLGELLSGNDAYSSAFRNLEAGGDDTFAGESTILLVGSRAASLFPELQLCEPAPCAINGADVTDEAAVVVAGEPIPVVGKLPRGAVWFDPNSSGLNLDKYRVILLEARQIDSLDEYIIEELFTRTVLIKPSPELVNDFITAAIPGGLYLVPEELERAQPGRFRENMLTAGYYVVASLAFLVLLALCYSTGLESIVRSELKTSHIRFHSGAQESSILFELSAFVFLATAFIPLAMCTALGMLAPSLRQGAALVGLAVVVPLAALVFKIAVLVNKKG